MASAARASATAMTSATARASATAIASAETNKENYAVRCSGDKYVGVG